MSLASPFAQAEQVLKESYNRALIAFQIEDYASAVTELDDLAVSPDLTPEQRQAVKDLLATALKKAPELAASRAAMAPPGTENPPEFPVGGPRDRRGPKERARKPFLDCRSGHQEKFCPGQSCLRSRQLRKRPG